MITLRSVLDSSPMFYIVEYCRSFCFQLVPAPCCFLHLFCQKIKIIDKINLFEKNGFLAQSFQFKSYFLQDRKWPKSGEGTKMIRSQRKRRKLKSTKMTKLQLKKCLQDFQIWAKVFLQGNFQTIVQLQLNLWYKFIIKRPCK